LAAGLTEQVKVATPEVASSVSSVMPGQLRVPVTPEGATRAKVIAALKEDTTVPDASSTETFTVNPAPTAVAEGGSMVNASVVAEDVVVADAAAAPTVPSTPAASTSAPSSAVARLTHPTAPGRWVCEQVWEEEVVRCMVWTVLGATR
jgi:cytoskeletal protein RodZ